MNSKQFSALFPLGSHLCREPMPPMAELKKDMANLKRHGFNLVKLQEHWQLDEPAEHCCDFSRYEELINHAARLDLGVYIGLTCEQAPAWLYRKHPDCRMVGRNGLTIAYESPHTLPADGKPGPCFDHPGARDDMCRFVTALVRNLGRFENVVIWNTWQEIAYWAEGLVENSVCFCPHTLAHFRGWLEHSFGTLDRLNRAWNVRYAEWQDILPSRSIGSKGPSAVDLHWQYFMDNIQIAAVLRARAAAIRAADPLHRPVFAHKGGPVIGSGMDWSYARTQDFLGSSCYPAWAPFHGCDDGRAGGVRLDRHAALRAEMWNTVALSYDYIRCCNPPGVPVWAAEFQGGPVSTGLQQGRIPTPADIRRWMLTAIGSGVSAISFWVTRAEIMSREVNGFSLLDSEGNSTPRYEEAARIGAALNRHPDLFAQPTWPGADVAILINEWNYLFCASMVQGGDNLPYSVRGWHRILWDAGIPVDFVELNHATPVDLQKYRTLILPFPLAIAETLAARLAAYVQQGGNLISEAAPGRMNEYTFCNRGELSPALRQLFGVRQQRFTMVREPAGGTRWSPAERTWGEYLDATFLKGTGPLANQRLRANVYVETFECRGGLPCLLYRNEVAGVVRRHGRGQAWLLGTYAGHNGTAYRDGDTRTALNALLAQCGIVPAHPGRLLLRKRVTPRKEAWLFTNPTSAYVTESIDVRGWRTVADLFGDPLPPQASHVRLTVPSLDLRVLVVTR